MIRLGILGTARIAGALVGYAMKDIGIAGIASRDRARADRFADEHAIRNRFGSYEAMIRSDAVDAVYIPLPPHLHLKYAIMAAESGKHVLLEKPAAVSADEVVRIMEACSRHGVLLMEGLMYRFMRVHQRAKELVEEGTIGTLRYVDFNFCFDIVERGRTGFRLNRDEGGGALLDLGIYAVDFLRFITDGEPVLLRAWTRTGSVDEFTHAVYRIGDTVAVITCSFMNDANYYVLSGSKGSITSPVAISGRPLPNRLKLHLLEGDRHYEESFEPENPYKTETEFFAECILNGREPFPGGANSLYNLRLLDELRTHAEPL